VRRILRHRWCSGGTAPTSPSTPTVKTVVADKLGCNPVLVDVRPRGMPEFRGPTSPYDREPFDRSKRVILRCASGSRSALSG